MKLYDLESGISSGNKPLTGSSPAIKVSPVDSVRVVLVT